jgi:3-oxoacyl-[acyl-carrier-protein] synthase II
MGAVTPLALSAIGTWEKLLAGQSGIDYISKFDTQELRVNIGGEVCNFNPTNYMDRKEARRLDPCIQFAVAAAKEAFADANLDITCEEPERVGAIIGTALGGFHSLIENIDAAAARGLHKVSPFMISNTLVDSAAGKLAIDYNLQGPNYAVTSACASGTAACGEAFELLRRGDADVMVTGGSEAPLLPIILSAFDIMGALSRGMEDPQTACRPFDRDRDGFVLSEGAAVLIMESEEHALKRGARIYAQVIGYGSSNDAYHMAAPHTAGRGAAVAMRMALRKAAAYGVAPDQIDYINAHGTATRLNDVTETMAIKQVLGEHAYNVHISSTKSMTGHLAGAAGALETMIGAKVIETGKVPPTINLQNQDPECDLNYTPNRAVEADVKVVLSNSFGLAGHNASIILRRYERDLSFCRGAIT